MHGFQVSSIAKVFSPRMHGSNESHACYIYKKSIDASYETTSEIDKKFQNAQSLVERSTDQVIEDVERELDKLYNLKSQRKRNAPERYEAGSESAGSEKRARK